MKGKNVDSGIGEKFRCPVDEATSEYAFIGNKQRPVKPKLRCESTKLIERLFAED